MATTSHEKSPKDEVRPRVAGHRERVQRVLENDIASGRRRAGERLDEREIAAQLQVSRTPVREALNRLSSLGLVEARPNQGCFVASLSFQDFLQQHEFMAHLEALCARFAAARMDERERAELGALSAASTQAAEAGDVERYIEINVDFHRVIYTGAKNRFLEQGIQDIRRKLAHFRGFSFQTPGRLRISSQEHAEIAAAIIAGNVDEAHRLMSHHLEILRPDRTDYLMMMAERLS